MCCLRWVRQKKIRTAQIYETPGRFQTASLTEPIKSVRYLLNQTPLLQIPESIRLFLNR